MAQPVGRSTSKEFSASFSCQLCPVVSARFASSAFSFICLLFSFSLHLFIIQLFASFVLFRLYKLDVFLFFSNQSTRSTFISISLTTVQSSAYHSPFNKNSDIARELPVEATVYRFVPLHATTCEYCLRVAVSPLYIASITIVIHDSPLFNSFWISLTPSGLLTDMSLERSNEVAPMRKSYPSERGAPGPWPRSRGGGWCVCFLLLITRYMWSEGAWQRRVFPAWPFPVPNHSGST